MALPMLLLIGPLKNQLSKLGGPEGGPKGLLGDLTKMLPKLPRSVGDILRKVPKP